MKVGGRKAYRPKLPLWQKDPAIGGTNQSRCRLVEGKMVAGLPKHKGKIALYRLYFVYSTPQKF